MKMEKVLEIIGEGLVKAFETLSFDPAGVYARAQDYTLPDWRHHQEWLTGGAGAAAAAIPVFHYATLPADILWLINRMDECCYGVGAIIGKECGKGNMLEKEDLANILALWGDHVTVHQLDRVVSESRGASSAGSTGALPLGRLAAASLGVVGAGAVTAPFVSKVAAKLGAKIAAKSVAGWIPVAGALVSGGINVWLVSSVSSAAEKYYIWKSNHWGQ